MIGAALIGLLVLTSVREARVAAVSDAAAETATAFLEARQAWNAEAAIDYLSEEAKVSIPPARSVEELPMELALLQTIGWIYEVDDCSVVEAHKFDDGTRRVLCSVTHHNDLSRALGVGPYTTTRFTMDVRDGLITSVILAVPMASYVNQTAAPFFDWLTENHPEDIEAMTRIGTITPALTVESIDLWKRYVAEFVAELHGRLGAASLGGTQRVDKEHRPGHWANPTRNRGDRASDFSHRIEINITHQTVIGAVDTNIDDRRTRFHVLCLDQPDRACGGDEDVGIAGHSSQVSGPSVRHRNRGVDSPFGEHQGEEGARRGTTVPPPQPWHPM